MKIYARKCPEGSDMVQNGPKWPKTCYIHFLIKKRLKIEFYIKNTENSTGAVKN